MTSLSCDVYNVFVKAFPFIIYFKLEKMFFFLIIVTIDNCYDDSIIEYLEQYLLRLLTAKLLFTITFEVIHQKSEIYP